MPTITFEVTELNTRRKTYRNALKDIFQGDDYKKHSFSTIEEAREFEKELNEKGIRTNLAKVRRYE